MAAMNTGGTGDIVEHERTGLLSASPDALGADLARLVADPRWLRGWPAPPASTSSGRSTRARSLRTSRRSISGSPACDTRTRHVPDRPLRVAVVGQSISGLHGIGGLERALYELVRHHLADGWDVTLITRPADGEAADPEAWHAPSPRTRISRCAPCPTVTFPFAGRRGTTVADRSTAYPLFGYRAGQDAARLVAQGRIDLVHSAGASGFGYAHAHQAAGGPRAPLVLNPHGLEEFGDADGQFAGHPLKGLAYAPLRRVVRATAAAADAVIATDAALRPLVERHLGVESARVHVIPNGLDLVEGAGRVDVTEGRALRQAQGIDPRDTVFLSVGRLEAEQGVSRCARPRSPRFARRAGDGC